jgi:hypothetical protein
MTPEQAQQRRQDAIRELVLGLERLTSAELSPGYGGRLDAMLLDYRGRVQSIETAEFDAADRRQYEAQADADFKRWQAGAYQPGAQPLHRGEARPRPTPGSEEERIQQAMDELARRGVGRL